jgi:transcriptional regulator with XRE-family HTH domain
MEQASSPADLKAAEIGSRLRELRKQRRLTQTDLARQIGMQQSDLSRMENGEYRVSLDSLFKILAVLDVEIGDFFDAEARRQEAKPQPLAHEDMQTLHLLRQLSLEGRREVLEFLEFKVRKSRAARVRRAGSQGRSSG